MGRSMNRTGIPLAPARSGSPATRARKRRTGNRPSSSGPPAGRSAGRPAAPSRRGPASSIRASASGGPSTRTTSGSIAASAAPRSARARAVMADAEDVDRDGDAVVMVAARIVRESDRRTEIKIRIRARIRQQEFDQFDLESVLRNRYVGLQITSRQAR